MIQLPGLPPEIEDSVLDQLGIARDRSTLASCALVSRRWLHKSRQSFFSRLGPIRISVYPSDSEEELLNELMFESPFECTFWSYILRVEIYGELIDEEQDEQPEFLNNVVATCLSRASRLNTLRFTAIHFWDLEDAVLSKIAATETVRSLELMGVDFTTPTELLRFLGSLPHLKKRIEMDSISFFDDSWDPSTSYHFLPDPGLRFGTLLSERNLSAMFQLIMHHNWCITNLHLAFYYGLAEDEYPQIGQILRHIGPSLKVLHVVADEKDAISLSYNTRLTALDLGTIVAYNAGNPVEPFTWLPNLLSSIESKARFRTFAGDIMYGEAEGDDGTGCHGIQRLDWKSVEDILLDKERFPGAGPVVTLRFVYVTRDKEISTLIREKCLPRLASAGRLRFAFTRRPF